MYVLRILVKLLLVMDEEVENQIVMDIDVVGVWTHLRGEMSRDINIVLAITAFRVLRRARPNGVCVESSYEIFMLCWSDRVMTWPYNMVPEVKS